MRNKSTSLLVILLALIIANTGFARADVQLCQSECEYSSLKQTTLPPCCKTKKTVTPILAKVDHDRAVSGECPHYGSNREITVPLTFISSAGTIPVVQQPAVFAILPTIEVQSRRIVSSYYSIRTGLSPPGRKNIPLYHLNCSLLI